MAFPVFGVTYTNIEYRLSKSAGYLSSADWQTRINHWIQQAAAQVASELKMIGMDASDVTPDLPMYLVCQSFIESYAARNVTMAMTRQDPLFAQAAAAEMKEFRQTIRQQPVGLLDDKFNNEEHLGSFSGSPGRASRLRRKAKKGTFFM